MVMAGPMCACSGQIEVPGTACKPCAAAAGEVCGRCRPGLCGPAQPAGARPVACAVQLPHHRLRRAGPQGPRVCPGAGSHLLRWPQVTQNRCFRLVSMVKCGKLVSWARPSWTAASHACPSMSKCIGCTAADVSPWTLRISCPQLCHLQALLRNHTCLQQPLDKAPSARQPLSIAQVMLAMCRRACPCQPCQWLGPPGA